MWISWIFQEGELFPRVVLSGQDPKMSCFFDAAIHEMKQVTECSSKRKCTVEEFHPTKILMLFSDTQNLLQRGASILLLFMVECFSFYKIERRMPEKLSFEENCSLFTCCPIVVNIN
ncbi:hypothetical protein NPIL_295701 [Nephila pilipes]|uniref:Uncharacterized protein n=1 Tax=Nephila pilipes TaxID=299642 RepID=A0A8X6R312_NEPPI|nr:hypothetical protein NPIL_295701 [Nephila pilipes]